MNKAHHCLAISSVALFAIVTMSQASMVVGPWSPLFKGIDRAVGTNFSSTTVTNNGVALVDSTRQVVHCLRIDLTDPTVQLFATPRATNNYAPESRETLSLMISNFVKRYGVQVATDANFYDVGGVSDPSSEGLSANVHGLLMSKGVVVSAADNGRYASLLFTTNNVPIFNFNNRAPGTNTTGIYTAVTGFYPVLTNGVNVWNLYFSAFSAAYPDASIHGFQPRTAFGISQDKHYLFMMTIDGRQAGYSDGAVDAETGMWMLLFGAWDAINMDGGGSTVMYMAGECQGNAIPLNHSSYPLTTSPPRERIIGAHFGVYAQPLVPQFILNTTSSPAMTTANITWTTLAPASSQVDFGLTTSYGSASTLDPTLVTSHNVTLTGLTPGTRYYYRVLSSDGVTQHSSACAPPFFTTNNQAVGVVYDLTKGWKYSANNLDGVSWQASGYNDSGWSNGLGVLWTDANNPGSGNPLIQFLPLNTEMPLDSSTTYPFITYYFRTHFTFTNSPSGTTLTFSNYMDDGAAFYLNGVEINRAYLPVGAGHATLASGYNCTGNADCPYVFTVSGANLQSGDNVVAVEVHNYSATSPDITFGQALSYTAPPPPPPPFISDLAVIPGETSATVTWTTISNSTSRLGYSLTTNINKATPIDTNLVTSHSVTVTGLVELTNYYFQAISSLGTNQYRSNGAFSTVPFYVGLVSLTNTWSYTTNNEDGITWQAPAFDESLMLGQGPALLYVETNPAVAPLNTPLPAASGGLPFPTYYFRTHFDFETNLAGFSLVFTNYIDDGAIFYLNGTEIQRVRMPPAPQPVVYTDFSTACPHPVDCDAVTNAPDVFRLNGDLLTNLVAGVENILAVEVHQRAANSSDIVFGSAMGLVRALASETELDVNFSGNIATISWDGLGFTLQQASTVMSTNAWSDVPGPIKTSPYSITNPPATTFYRLRN